ncbi:MAG: hypothetical protein ACHQQ3_06895 [Gemmatimonadales bacterium]
MPSDPRLQQVLDALARPIADFRALVQGALAQTATWLDAQTADTYERAARSGAELGRFAEGRVDAARFSALFPAARPADAPAIAALRRAADTLLTVRERGDSLFTVDVPAGGRLGDAIGAALAEAGRAFGAVVVSELVRGGRYLPAEHDPLLDSFEFRTWNKAERRFAPPLVVTVGGSDLHASDLAPFTDGREKLVLVVHGACAAAPLARSVTPGTLVLQTVDGSGLDRVAAFDGPAIAAMVPEGAATFLHDPLAGREPWQRLTVTMMPEPPKRALGGQSVWQMSEELRLLADLARTPFAVPSPGGAPKAAVGASDAADRIAQWLLGESGLAGS